VSRGLLAVIYVDARGCCNVLVLLNGLRVTGAEVAALVTASDIGQCTINLLRPSNYQGTAAGEYRTLGGGKYVSVAGGQFAPWALRYSATGLE
jgi:hypothetical protein